MHTLENYRRLLLLTAEVLRLQREWERTHNILKQRALVKQSNELETELKTLGLSKAYMTDIQLHWEM